MSFATTSHTLIQRAYDLGDEDAWSTLVRQYECFIFYILQRMNVAASDLPDVSQQVLMKLTRDLRNYDQQRSKFRNWLGHIVSQTALSYFRQQEREQVRIQKFGVIQESHETSLATEFENLVQKEWADFVVTQAVERLRSIFTGKAVEVFELGLQECSAEEIAKKTGLSVSSVYTLRKRVKKRLYIEIRALIKELEP